MEKYELQKLRDLPIEEVAERLGMRVVRHKCLCPFHDDHHASLSFKVSKNTFRCFVCGAHGGTIAPPSGQAAARQTETAAPRRSAKAVQNTFQIDSHQTRMPGTVLFV